MFTALTIQLFHVEVLKMVFSCSEPGPSSIKGLKASGCFHAKAKSPCPSRTGDAIFEVDTFGTTNPLVGHNGPQLNISLISALGLCASGIQGWGQLEKGTRTRPE